MRPDDVVDKTSQQHQAYPQRLEHISRRLNLMLPLPGVQRHTLELDVTTFEVIHAALRQLYGKRVPKSTMEEQKAEGCEALLEGKKLFCTETGLFGVGPADMTSGDELVVAIGAKTPYILRKNEDVTSLVGEAYVDGLMDGGVDGLHERYPDEFPVVDLVTAPHLRQSLSDGGDGDEGHEGRQDTKVKAETSEGQDE